METQLGGKYSKEDQGLFDLKARLMDAGIHVAFPMYDKIVTEQNGIELTFDPSKEGMSFYEAELRYLRAIRNNPVHFIHNKFREDLGYIGESASVEMAYAMVHNRPIVLLYPPQFSPKAPVIVQDIVAANTGLLHVARIDQMEASEIREFALQATQTPTQYDITVEQELEVMRTVDKLLDSYRSFE